MCDIKNLDALLKEVIGENELIKKETKSLIGPGENYGSVMLSLDLTIKEKKTGKQTLLNLVAKNCAPTEFIKQLFNIQVTYRKEVEFYKQIIPEMNKFQKEFNGNAKFSWDFFPKYYASRYTCIENKNLIDDDFCLVLENAKYKGFECGDRMTGFDFDTALFVMEHLAKLHAVPIAMKLKCKERFEEVKKTIDVNTCTKNSFPEYLRATMIEEILKNIKDYKKFDQYLEKIEKFFKETQEIYYNARIEAEEPFATIVHGDFWVNNMMIKYNNQQKVPSKMYFVDFQLVSYSNPANDVLFFIYTSVQNKVVNEHFQELIDRYHETFLDILRDLQVDTIEEFSREKLNKEFRRSIQQSQLLHILMMFMPLFTCKGKAMQLEDINENSLSGREKLDEEKYYARLDLFLTHCIQNNWI